MLIDPVPGEDEGHRDKVDRPVARRLFGKPQLIAVVATFSLLLFIALWLDSAHAFAGNSDGATVILEGRSMSSGNLLLSGWSLSLDSFWGLDTVFYSVATGLVGVHGYLLHAVPAAIVICVVALGVTMAHDARRNGRSIAGVVAAVVLLGAPTGALSTLYLNGPLHVATTLWVLLAFFALRNGRFGQGWALAVVLLAIGILGDLQTLPLGVGPVVGLGLVEMARRRTWRAAVHATSAGLASVILAIAIRAAALASGTYSIGRGSLPAPLRQVPANIAHLPTYAAWLFGLVSNPFDSTSVPKVVAISHGVGLVVVLASVIAALVGLLGGVRKGLPPRLREYRANRHLDDLLVLAFLANLVMFVAITPSDDPSFSRYLTASYIFGATLAARAVTRVAERRGSTIGGRIAGVVAMAVAGGYGMGLLGEALAPPAPNPSVQLAAFLRTHHLDRGVGDYWSASITTVVSNNKVVIRPVIANSSGQVVRYGHQSSVHWYKGKNFHFFVYNPTAPWGGVNPASIRATFGPWAQSYTVGPYVVLTWDKAIHVVPVGYY